MTTISDVLEAVSGLNLDEFSEGGAVGEVGVDLTIGKELGVLLHLGVGFDSLELEGLAGAQAAVLGEGPDGLVGRLALLLLGLLGDPGEGARRHVAAVELVGVVGVLEVDVDALHHVGDVSFSQRPDVDRDVLDDLLVLHLEVLQPTLDGGVGLLVLLQQLVEGLRSLQVYHVRIVVLRPGKLFLLEVLLLNGLDVHFVHDLVEVLQGEVANLDLGLVLPVYRIGDRREHIAEENDHALGRKLLFILGYKCGYFGRDV